MARPRIYPFDAVHPGESLALPWPETLPRSRENRRYRRRALAALRQEQRLYEKRFMSRDEVFGITIVRAS